MKIQILTKTFDYTDKNAIIFPFLAFKKKINEASIFFDIKTKFQNLKNSDIIILDSKYFRLDWLKHHSNIFDRLKELKNKCNKLVYYDTTDSTAIIKSEIFDYVDEYWKFQILKDKNQYKKKFYGGRIFTNYYHENFGVEDQDILICNPLIDKDLNKIKVAWNFGLSDFSTQSKILFYLRKKLIFSYFFNFKKKKIPKKKYDIFCTFNKSYSRKTIAFQRKIISKNLVNYRYKKLSNKIYHSLLSQSRAVISPFGWGEICYRDFEAFSNKCVLIKPNLDHLITWPNFFKKNETYVDFNWDLSNFSEIVNQKNFDNYELRKIASNGYEIYNKYTSNPEAGYLFLSHLKNLLHG